jgi:hypothetical protein
MYFYQKNFIYDVSGYSKTKDTTNNILTISNINISDLSYYNNNNTKPRILLNTGNFSPWGANDVLISDNWNIIYNSSTGLYTLNLKISNLDITNYDINLIKYMIFTEKINTIEISGSDSNFRDFIVLNNTLLIIKLSNGSKRFLYLTPNTMITKTSTSISISTPSNHILYTKTLDFSTTSSYRIELTRSVPLGWYEFNFPHYIVIKMNNTSNVSGFIIKLNLIIRSNNIDNIVQTYYFSVPATQLLNTFTLIPLYPEGNYTLDSLSKFILEFNLTSNGNTLITNPTILEVQYSYFLPINNLIINF